MGDAATPVLPDFTSQADATYKANLDAAAAVSDRLSWPFAPHEQSTPNLTVKLEAGWVPKLAALPAEVAAQNTSGLTAPSGNPRKDIIYIDQASGAVGVATGAENASPVDPAVPSGKIAVGRINWIVGQPSITNSDIDDLRNPYLLGAAAALAGVGVKNSSGLLDLDIAGLPDTTTPIPADSIPILDGGVESEITLQNLLKVINGLTEDTTPEDGDFLLQYDVSAGVVKKIRKDNIGGAYTSISNTAITAVTNIDVTGFLPGTYDNYEVWLSNGQPANDGVLLELETSTDGGSTFDTGASDYTWSAWVFTESAAGVGRADADDNEIQLHGVVGVGNAANENINVYLFIFRPGDTEFTAMTWDAITRDASTLQRGIVGVGDRQSAADVDALRFHWSAGDFAAQGAIQFLGIAQ